MLITSQTESHSVNLIGALFGVDTNLSLCNNPGIVQANLAEQGSVCCVGLCVWAVCWLFFLKFTQNDTNRLMRQTMYVCVCQSAFFLHLHGNCTFNLNDHIHVLVETLNKSYSTG